MTSVLRKGLIGESSAGAPTLLEFRDVTVVRGGRKALAQVDLRIESGENVAILGPNGCGKSTLVKLIDRELYASSNGGSVRIFGQERWEVGELRGLLGIVTNDLQEAIPSELTAVEAVVAGFTGKLGVFYDDVTDERRFAARAALTLAAAGHLASRQFGSLSSGEARRVLIARALAHRPQTLLLDEPTTSLDIKSAHALLKTLRSVTREGIGLVLVTHHLEEILPEINRVVLLKQGRILIDGPRQAVMTSTNLSNLFDIQVDVKGDGPYSARIVNP